MIYGRWKKGITSNIRAPTSEPNIEQQASKDVLECSTVALSIKHTLLRDGTFFRTFANIAKRQRL